MNVSGTYSCLRLERVHYGRPLAEAVREEIEARAAERVVIVPSKTLARKTPVVDGVADALGARCVGRFEETVEHVPRDSVLSLARNLRELRADLVLTLGGGTPIDTVKMALLCLAENVVRDEDLERCAVSTRPDGSRYTPHVGRPPIRQIVAPTTLSGAEFSDLAGCVHATSGLKQLFSGDEIGAASVILDPEITTHTPEDLWLSTGVRAVDHAVETLCSSAPSPFADAGALHALRLLGRSLRAVQRDPFDLGARLESQQAVWLACQGLNRVPYGASHGLGHQLGALAGVSHGHTSCVMLPHVLAYNEPATSRQQQQIAEALGQPARKASEAVAELIEDLGLPRRLRDVGVGPGQLAAIARGSLASPWVRANPRPIDSAGQLEEILEKAY